MIGSIWMYLAVLTGFNPSINALTAPSLLPWIPCLRAERHFGEKVDILPHAHLYLKQHKKVCPFLFALPGPQQKIRKSLGLGRDRKLAIA